MQLNADNILDSKEVISFCREKISEGYMLIIRADNSYTLIHDSIEGVTDFYERYIKSNNHDSR